MNKKFNPQAFSKAFLSDSIISALTGATSVAATLFTLMSFVEKDPGLRQTFENMRFVAIAVASTMGVATYLKVGDSVNYLEILDILKQTSSIKRNNDGTISFTNDNEGNLLTLPEVEYQKLIASKVPGVNALPNVEDFNIEA